MYQMAVKRLFDHLQPSQVPNVASLLAQALSGNLVNRGAYLLFAMLLAEKLAENRYKPLGLLDVG